VSPQEIVDAWLAHAMSDKRIRRDLTKYCRTRFDRDDLIRATNTPAEFTEPCSGAV
jgi:hypothetical protein